jgi:hypothetical protein
MLLFLSVSQTFIISYLQALTAPQIPPFFIARMLLFPFTVQSQFTLACILEHSLLPLHIQSE